MIDRKILSGYFSLHNFPTLRCPRCQEGAITPVEKLEIYEPSYSQDYSSHIASEAKWIRYQLVCTLKCSNLSCGQLSAFHADGGLEWERDQFGGHYYEQKFRITSVHPSPNIVQLPANLDASIKAPLMAAFDVFWNNKKLCANSVRQAIEALLDYHGVSRVTERGKWQSMAARISAFKQTNSKYAELFELFRPILNFGSHGAKIQTETLLDVLEALELYLAQEFDDKGDRLTELETLLRNSQESPKGHA